MCGRLSFLYQLKFWMYKTLECGVCPGRKKNCEIVVTGSNEGDSRNAVALVLVTLFFKGFFFNNKNRYLIN